MAPRSFSWSDHLRSDRARTTSYRLHFVYRDSTGIRERGPNHSGNASDCLGLRNHPYGTCRLRIWCARGILDSISFEFFARVKTTSARIRIACGSCRGRIGFSLCLPGRACTEKTRIAFCSASYVLYSGSLAWFYNWRGRPLHCRLGLCLPLGLLIPSGSRTAGN